MVSSGTATSWDNVHCISGAARRMQRASVAKQLRSVGNNRKAVFIYAKGLQDRLCFLVLGVIWDGQLAKAACILAVICS